MSSNYTGNYAAVETPATAPAVNNPPVLVLASDGDAANAASIAQALKVLADNEDFILKILGGSRTAKSFQTDGTGGAAATVASGDITASANVNAGTALVGPKATLSTNQISTTSPNPAFAAGSLFKDLVPVAGGYISNSGTPAIVCGFGISSVSLVATGVVDVTILNTLLSTTKCFVTAILDGNGWAYWFVGNTTTTKIRIGTSNSTGAAANIGFTFVLYGSV